MNTRNTSQIKFPIAPPELRLKRSTEKSLASLNELQASLVEGQRQLEANHHAIREREEWLLTEEARLQDWQNQLEQTGQVSGSSGKATDNPATLEAGWTKLHRSRELLEEEQRQLCADRLAMNEACLTLRQREADLVAREARVAEGEQRIREFEEATARKSTGVLGLTRTPFSFAKSVFTKS